MSLYINVNTNEYPVYQTEIKSLFPNTSFESEFKPPYPYEEVIESIMPTVTAYQTYKEINPKFLEGKWYRNFEVIDYTVEEITAINNKKSDSVRKLRDKKLLDSDWTQVLDAPVDKAAWATYRQSLRDITIQPGFPQEIQWPTPPV